jgi:hypothetical protein
MHESQHILLQLIFSQSRMSRNLTTLLTLRTVRNAESPFIDTNFKRTVLFVLRHNLKYGEISYIYTPILYTLHLNF